MQDIYVYIHTEHMTLISLSVPIENFKYAERVQQCIYMYITLTANNGWCT